MKPTWSCQYLQFLIWPLESGSESKSVSIDLLFQNVQLHSRNIQPCYKNVFCLCSKFPPSWQQYCIFIKLHLFICHVIKTYYLRSVDALSVKKVQVHSLKVSEQHLEEFSCKNWVDSLASCAVNYQLTKHEFLSIPVFVRRVKLYNYFSCMLALICRFWCLHSPYWIC